MLTIYLSGKMSGLPDFGRGVFNSAEETLKGKGFTVLNPAWLPYGMEYSQYMAIDMAMLREADLICMLPGWETSKGALAEKVYAEAVGKPVTYLEDYEECWAPTRNARQVSGWL